MNFRIKVSPKEVAIFTTEEAVDHVDVHPTLKIARGYVADRVEKMIEQLRLDRKAALKVAEKDLRQHDPVV